MSRRTKTSYPGVFYRVVDRIGGKGSEKVFYIIFKKDGKNLEEKVGRQYVDNMTPAKAAGIRAERIEGKRQSRKEIREALKAKKEVWTVNKLWGEYKKNRKPKGIVTDRNRFEKHIEPILGKKEPRDILPLDVDRLRINLLKIRAPGTVKNVLELLRRITNFGVKKRLCRGLDFTIEMPKVNNEKTEDLTDTQLNKLLETLDQSIDIQAANFMKMALFTGMRRGELFKLKWKNIDFERGFINIKNPKGGPDQKIPLNEVTRSLLESHPKSDSSFVFPGKNGKQRTEIKRPVNHIKEKAGLPKDFRPLHGLRHVYASMLASSGEVDMYVLQRLLTHKSSLMTQRYSHLRDSALKQASDLAGQIIKEATSKKVVKLEDHSK